MEINYKKAIDLAVTELMDWEYFLNRKWGTKRFKKKAKEKVEMLKNTIEFLENRKIFYENRAKLRSMGVKI